MTATDQHTEGRRAARRDLDDPRGTLPELLTSYLHCWTLQATHPYAAGYCQTIEASGRVPTAAIQRAIREIHSRRVETARRG